MAFFSPKIPSQQQQKKKLLNISDDQINSNQQATPVKYLAGRRYVAGDYISPAYNQISKAKKTTTGKGESTVTGYVYFADFAQIFCMGGRVPVRGVRTVIVDSEIVWTGTVDKGAAEYEDITVAGHGQLRIYWGSDTQPIDPLVLTVRGVVPVDPDFNARDKATWPKNSATGGQTTNNGDASGDENPLSGHYDRHPAYRGQCYAVFKKWKLGRDRTQIPNIQLELIRDVPFVGGTTLASDDRGVPVAGLLYDWFTDDRFGPGLAESLLVTASLSQMAIDLVDFRLSPLISTQEQFRSVIAKLLEYFDGWVRRTGKQLEFGYWSHGNIDTSALPVISDDDFDGEPDLKPTGFGATLNEVSVQYKDRAHHFNDYPQVYRDANNRRIVGEPRAVFLQRDWLTDSALAKKYATEFGTMHALPSQQGTVAVKRESLSSLGLLPGMRFKLNSNTYGLSIVCRLNEIEWPEDKSAKAKLTIEAERGLWPTLYIAPPALKDGDFEIGPIAIANHRILELPSSLRTKPNVAQIVAFAQRSVVEVVGFRVWSSGDNTTFDTVSDRNTFAVFGKLASDYSGTTSDPDVTTGAQIYLYGVDLDLIVSQSDQARDDNELLLFVDGEIMSVGQVTALGDGLYSIFVRRAQYGTTQAAHTAGADCWFIHRDKLVIIDKANFLPGATIYFKLQPYTELQDYDLASVSSFTYTFAAVYHPGPPTSALVFPTLTGVNVQWVNPNEVFDHIEILSSDDPQDVSPALVGVEAAPGTSFPLNALNPPGDNSARYYWLCTVDAAGNKSAATFAGSAVPGRIIGDVTISPNGGNISGATTITLNCATPNAQIFWRADSTTPTNADNLYNPASKPVVSATSDFSAIAFLSGTYSAPVHVSFVLNTTGVSTPTATPAPGSYATATGTQDVVIATSTPSAQIRYTLDGTAPTSTSGILIAGTSGTVTLPSGSINLRAIAFRSSWTDSAVTNWNYIVTQDSGGGGGSSVENPAFLPRGGTFHLGGISSGRQILVATKTPRAKVRYTQNGSQPTSGSAGHGTESVYNIESHVVSLGSTTEKAIAYQNGLTDSAVTTEIYNLDAAADSGAVFAPELLPAGTYKFSDLPTGTFGPSGDTTTYRRYRFGLACASPNTSMRYTRDSSTPTAGASGHGTLIASAADIASILFDVDATLPFSQTIKAIAYRSGSDFSSVATFVINFTA